MIVVDASAVLAVVLKEPQASHVACVLAAATDFAHAMVRTMGAPLPFVDDNFSGTDIEPAGMVTE